MGKRKSTSDILVEEPSKKRIRESNGASAVDKPRLTAEEKDAKRKRKEEKKLRKEARAAKKLKKAAKETAKVLELANLPKDVEKSPEDYDTNQLSKLPNESGVVQSSASNPNTSGVDIAKQTSKSPTPTKSLQQMGAQLYLEKNDIKIIDPTNSSGEHNPITSFGRLPGAGKAYADIFKTFREPTPIQAATWPFLFAGRDVIGVAETGSGKTLAFGVPCLEKIKALPSKDRKKIKAVVVSPTRELACQIFDQLVKLAEPLGLHATCVYGGVPKDQQRADLKRTQIVVATPGRLNDLISEDAADLSNADYVCLDEADRMLDKGFEEDIKKIVSATTASKSRQTVMFTATWPPSVRDLANTFMKTPVQIYIGNTPTGELKANARIEQIVEVMDPRNKETRLNQLLQQYTKGGKSKDRILVFCLYKKEAARIEGFIRSRGFNVVGIHGDLVQAKRTAALHAFKSGTTPIMVATDVAARGLDIPAVKLVINVTFPLTAEDYVHRIGRTGRAGESGRAITFFTDHEKPLSGALINVLKAANQPVPEELLKFGTTVKKKEHSTYGAFFRDTEGMKKATKITFD